MNLDQVYLGTSYCLSSYLVWRGLSGGEMGVKLWGVMAVGFWMLQGLENKSNLKLSHFTRQVALLRQQRFFFKIFFFNVSHF